MLSRNSLVDLCDPIPRFVAVLAVAVALPAAPVAAQSITVDTLADEFDAVANASCALREAIESVNTDTSFGGCTNPGGANTIVMGPGTHVLDIPNAVGPVNASGSVRLRTGMTIQGAGPGTTTVQADPGLDSNMIDVNVAGSGTATLEGFTVTGGPEGAIDMFRESPGLTRFIDMEIRDNSTPFGGAGVDVQGSTMETIQFERVELINNVAEGGGGGIDCGISSSGSEVDLQLTDVLFRDNRAAQPAPPIAGGAPLGGPTFGGGLLISGCDATLENVTFEGNEADNGAGMVISDYFNTDASVSMTNTTFFDNTASDSGGGIFAIFGSLTGSALAIDMTNVTLAGNTATNGGGLFNNAAAIDVRNLLLGGNNGDDCDGNPLPNLNSLGGNRDSDGTCALAGPGDTSGPAGLAPALSDEGGFTPVLALLPGSAAIDLASNTGCPPGDQRGVARPQDGDSDGSADCDPGAYELEPQISILEIPTLSGWGLVIMIALLAWLTLWQIRRRAT